MMTSGQPLGALIGAFTATRFLNCMGGGIRKTLLVLDYFALAFTVLIIIDKNVFSIMAGRFLCGLIQGVNTALIPIYIKSFSPEQYSGSTGTFT
jgi:predicted MFS family arabinose efflux permease